MPPLLFDPNCVARNRQRARAMPETALFLHQRVVEQVSERLIEINKRFTRPAIVTAFPDIWRDFLPDATLVAEAEALDLAPGAHDLVIHVLGLHWSNDPVGQLIQCRRALQPDGLFLGTLFGGRSLHELRASLAEAESRVKSGLSPRVSPMAELRDLGGLLQRAGLALPVADADTFDVTYADLASLMHDLRAMGETNALAARPKAMTARALINAASEIYAANFTTDEHRLNATVEMIYLTGWAPSENQQKPLRPGSAQTRLADALGTTEFTANNT